MKLDLHRSAVVTIACLSLWSDLPSVCLLSLQISLSSQVMPMVKMVPRGLTTCIDAYLTPVINTCTFIWIHTYISISPPYTLWLSLSHSLNHADLKSFKSGFDANLDKVGRYAFIYLALSPHTFVYSNASPYASIYTHRSRSLLCRVMVA